LAGDAGALGGEPALERLEALARDFQVEPVLRAEVVVGGGEVGARPLGDLAQRGAPEAAGSEALAGGVEQAAAGGSPGGGAGRGGGGAAPRRRERGAGGPRHGTH